MENFGRLMDTFYIILIVSQFPNYSALDTQSFSSTLSIDFLRDTSERESSAEVGFKCYAAARNSISWGIGLSVTPLFGCH